MIDLPPTLLRLLPVAASLLVMVAVIALVRWANPKRAPRTRRLLFLAGGWVALDLIEIAASHGAEIAALRWLRLGSDVCGAWLWVDLLAALIFDVMMPTLGISVVSIAYDLLVGFGFIAGAAAVLSAAGVDLTSVVAASTVAAAILSLSLQSTLGNIIGGVALQIDGSISEGDWIQLESGKQAKIREVRWRHTVAETRDGDLLIIPNATLLQNTILVLGRRGGATRGHRMWVYFHVDFRFPPSQVIQVVQDALATHDIPNVDPEISPDCVCMDLARDGRESYAVYAVRYWIIDVKRDDPTSSVVRARLHAALRRAGIPLARPVQTVLYAPADDVDEEQIMARRRDRAARVLDDVHLFTALSPEERSAISARLVFTPFARGEYITRQGSVAHWLYLLSSGAVEIRTSLDGGAERLVNRIESPGFFGEMGLLTGEPRLASVVAVTDVECFRLDKHSVEELIRERSDLARQLSETVAERRVTLLAVRENLDEAGKAHRVRTEQERILERIRTFFGLG
jgi:small-conductance mechanosensitive channel/CRP-like cAMP-binding protein